MAIDNHYSDIILNNLVENFGWEFSEGTGSVKKNVGGGATNGELNPTGVRIVTAIFDEPARRYLTLQSGFDNILDVDCRDRDTKEAAEEFDSKVRDWVVKAALPEGWTEAYRGGIATNRDPLTGGIVDKEIVSGLWFAIANSEYITETMEGFPTRFDAMAALQAAIKNNMDVTDPTTPEGYAKVITNKSLQEKYQDDLDTLFQHRLVSVRNALREIDGWDYGLQPIFSNEDIVKNGKSKAEFSFTYAGAGMNVVGYSVNGVVDDLTNTPEQFAAEINSAHEQIFIKAFFKSWELEAEKINAVVSAVNWDAIISESIANVEHDRLHSAFRSINDIEDARKQLNEIGIRNWDDRLSSVTSTKEFKLHGSAMAAYRAARDRIYSVVKEKIKEAGKAELALLNSDSSLDDMAKAIYRKNGIDIGDGSSGYLTKLTNAIRHKEVEYLRSVLGNKDNVASAELFVKATGIKLPSTQRDTLIKIDGWAGITPEQRQSIELDKSEKRNRKNKLNEVVTTWGYLEPNRVKLGNTQPSIPVQEWIRTLSEEGKNHIFSSKSGVATYYYLSKDESGAGGNSIKNKNWSLFLKAAKAVGGLQQALNAVDEHLKQMAEADASKPDENIAASFAPSTSM